MSDLPSQYAEDVETFRQILDLPDPRETLPRSLNKISWLLIVSPTRSGDTMDSSSSSSAPSSASAEISC